MMNAVDSRHCESKLTLTQKRTHAGAWRHGLGLGAVCLILLVVLDTGCGSDSDTATPTARPTVTATPTVNATATTTPLPSVSGQENLFGSSTQGGGSLTIVSLSQIPTYFSTCLGGSGTTCDGGTSIYIGSDPGFKESEADLVGMLFALPAGVAVGLEVIAIDPAVSLKFDNGTLSAAGQSVAFGTTPGIHADLEWQLQLGTDAQFNAPHPVTLKLTTTTNGFVNSSEFTEVIHASSGIAPE